MSRFGRFLDRHGPIIWWIIVVPTMLFVTVGLTLSIIALVNGNRTTVEERFETDEECVIVVYDTNIVGGDREIIDIKDCAR